MLGFWVVLNKLSEQVRCCYRRAGECRELAELTTTPIDQAFYLDREQSWLLLARSYELQDRTGLFVDELQRRGRLRRGLTPICPDCEAPKVVCSSTVTVCTNCRRVLEDR